jgi:hypothetical protein
VSQDIGTRLRPSGLRAPSDGGDEEGSARVPLVVRVRARFVSDLGSRAPQRRLVPHADWGDVQVSLIKARGRARGSIAADI